MAGKSIDILISTIFKATGIDAAKRAMANMGKTIGRNLANIKAGFDLAASGIKTFISALSKGMAFERMTLQFKQLTGSMEDAKRHMKDLQDLGRTPPFDLESFASASREMMKMSGGILGFKKDLEIVGDMAAATGNDISAVGRAFGTAYQIIRDGQSFGRAGQQLFQLGILTKKQVEEFDALSKSGANNAEVWQKLTEQFSRYKGAMAETEKTTQGLVDAIQGEANVAITNFSAAITETAKPALEGLLGWMKRINEDGTIEDWADQCVKSLGTVGEAVNDFGYLWKNSLGTVLAFARGADKAFKDGKWYDIAGQIRAGKENAIRYYNGEDEDPERAKFKAEISEKKAKEKAEAVTKAEAAKAARLAADLAEAQKKRDDEARAKDFDSYIESGSADTFDRWLENKVKATQNAKTEYAKYIKDAGLGEIDASDIDDYDEAFKKWRIIRDKRLAQESKDAKKAADARLAADLKVEEEAHRQRIENIRTEHQERIRVSQEDAQSKQTTIAAAQTEFDKAFAMYRDKELAASTIAEERDYAADYKRLNKDAARYGGKWRIDELASLMMAGDTQGQASKLEEWRKSKKFTPEVEAMVRASAADQTKTTAEAELRKIEANTADLARKLDELLSMK